MKNSQIKITSSCNLNYEIHTHTKKNVATIKHASVQNQRYVTVRKMTLTSKTGKGSVSGLSMFL